MNEHVSCLNFLGCRPVEWDLGSWVNSGLLYSLPPDQDKMGPSISHLDCEAKQSYLILIDFQVFFHSNGKSNT